MTRRLSNMVVNGRPLKRMKRRVTADLQDFLTFPSVEGSGSGTTLPFRASVRSFLSEYALLPPPSSLFPHLMTWQILFRVGDLRDGPDSMAPATVCLDVVEEDVARSRSVYCDQCRVVGELARFESFFVLTDYFSLTIFFLFLEKVFYGFLGYSFAFSSGCRVLGRENRDSFHFWELFAIYDVLFS